MLHAILLPSQIVVCKYVADTKVTDLVVRGTAAADATAKAAARTPLTNTLAVSLPADNPWASFSEMQALAAPDDDVAKMFLFEIRSQVENLN